MVTGGPKDHIVGGMEPKMFVAHVPLDAMTRDEADAHFDKEEAKLVAANADLELMRKEDEVYSNPINGDLIRRTWWFYPPGIKFAVGAFDTDGQFVRLGYELSDEILSSREFTRRNS